MVLCFVQIDKLYNCVYILSYQFILIKRTSHKPLHELVFYFLCIYRKNSVQLVHLLFKSMQLKSVFLWGSNSGKHIIK